VLAFFSTEIAWGLCYGIWVLSYLRGRLSECHQPWLNFVRLEVSREEHWNYLFMDKRGKVAYIFANTIKVQEGEMEWSTMLLNGQFIDGQS